MRLESCFTDCQWRYNNSTITDRGKDESKNMWKCGNLTSLISPSLHKECRASIRRASGLFVSFCKSLKHDTLYCEWSPSLTFHVLEFIWLVVIEYLYLQYCVPRQITLKLKGTVRAIKDTNYTVCFLHPSHFTTSLWGTTAAPNLVQLELHFSFVLDYDFWIWGTLPMSCIYGLLPVLKAEQQLHLLAQSRQKSRETNNDLVNHFQCSRVVLTIFIVLCLGQTEHLISYWATTLSLCLLIRNSSYFLGKWNCYEKWGKQYLQGYKVNEHTH